MDEDLPGAAGSVARDHPDLWDSFTELGRAASEAGPLEGATRRLVKLALAIGTGSEGAVHSHARRALDEGITPQELEHVAVLAVPTIGFPKAIAALTWIRDVTEV